MVWCFDGARNHRRWPRRSSLEDALYAVAAAKFSAELVNGVGGDTTICISRKLRSTDAPEKTVHSE